MSQYKIRPAFRGGKPASQWQKPFGLSGTNQSDWKEKDSCKLHIVSCKPGMLARGLHGRQKYLEITPQW
ncbi:hypothetical protein [Pseudomonas sp. Kh13]|uniref:hypothetical protein n=1 Tax=Pseudomonas sp. Kh13 TaxID=2093744 RepID=UPI0015B442E1|nr:hypothetical protein [Pseudomonas sp. Kh13]